MQPTVHVIATTLDGTRAALSAAVPLARGADARLIVLVPRILSIDDDPESDPESNALFVKRYEEMAQHMNATADIQMCPCQTLDDLVAKIFAGHSRVVVGGPVGRWLTSPEERFANRLARAGCQVVFAPSGANTTQRRVAA